MSNHRSHSRSSEPPPAHAVREHPVWRYIGALTLVTIAWFCVAVMAINHRAFWVIAVATIAAAWAYELALEEHHRRRRG
jgi:hypothetical protein